jgi:hypothetical protein
MRQHRESRPGREGVFGLYRASSPDGFRTL